MTKRAAPMREMSSISLGMQRQGQYLDRMLRVEKLNKLALVEFRQMVKLVNRLMVNLTDFNAVYFRPSSLRRKSPSEGSHAAAKA